MYSLDMAAIRRNWMAANSKPKKVKVKIASTCYPDTNDFNQASMHRKKELDKIILP